MNTSLKDRQYYIDLYDHITVKEARRNIKYYDEFYDEFQKIIPEGETFDKPSNALILNSFYMQCVGIELLNRYENRDDCVDKWILDDKSKDRQVSNARLTIEPNCQHCNEKGLRIIDKTLMHRKVNGALNNHQEVLFMLHCPHCDKNSAYWEDGTGWESDPTFCPKCNERMTHKTKETKKSIILSYTCPSCQYNYIEKIDIESKKETIDPDYEKDRVHYCLLDKEFRDQLFEIRESFTYLTELSKELEDKEDNKEACDAMNEIKKLKIAELVEILQPTLQKAGYIDFDIEKPEIGRDVIVNFNCLDSKTDRGDYDSKKMLEKSIKKELGDTNWRLMSDGVSYRLGYLSGRLRAYEREEDLKQLVNKTSSNK